MRKRITNGDLSRIGRFPRTRIGDMDFFGGVKCFFNYHKFKKPIWVGMIAYEEDMLNPIKISKREHYVYQCARCSFQAIDVFGPVEKVRKQNDSVGMMG